MQTEHTGAVDLFWIPLGAGGHSVRFNGRVFEAIQAARQHRRRCDLYHAALVVALDGDRYTIELAPSPDADEANRGVVGTAAVGSRYVGWIRLFRYEVRCWRGGSIPDLGEAVGGPRRLTSDPRVAGRLLDLVASVPRPVWGRDELNTGEMWNSNSMSAWLIAMAGLPTDLLLPPPRGRAPGWHAGIEMARRSWGAAGPPRESSSSGDIELVTPDHHRVAAPGSPRYFDPASLTALDEPVQRYLNHALAPGMVIAGGRRFDMDGRIKVGRWLAFDAVQEMWRDGHAFTWTARAGLGPFRPLRVVDRYRLGAGSTEGRLFGRLRFMHADDEDTARSAAGRAAVESVMDPASLLPGNGVSWQAESDDLIVARFDVPPERARVQLRIDPIGALRSVEIMRWGNVGQHGFSYIPFGGDIHAEGRFGDLVVPSELTIGWWYGTARYSPFFHATVQAED